MTMAYMWVNCGGGGGYDCVVEVVWRWVDAAFGPASALVSTPTDEGCRQCTATLRDLPALC
jgi:hypothetical protein